MALARHTETADLDTMTLGKVLAQSGYFQDARDAAQAVVKVLAGRELGFSAIASMTGINIIKGRVTLSANLIASAIKRSKPAYDYKVRELTDQVCSIAFFEDGEEVGVSTFTAADARKAGTQNMDKFPRNMLFARAMSNGAKWYCAGVFGGPVYTPDELGAQVDEAGEVVTPRYTAEPEPARPQLVEQPAEGLADVESRFWAKFEGPLGGREWSRVIDLIGPAPEPATAEDWYELGRRVNTALKQEAQAA